MMTAQIPKNALILFCVLAFVVGLGGYTGFHFAVASEKSSQEVQGDSDSQNDGDSNLNSSAEGESPASQDSDSFGSINDPNDYLLHDSSTRQYTSLELEGLDNYRLYLARNEIFARHGRTFRNPSLNEYFMQKSWYVPMYTPDDFDALDAQVSLLNEYEKYNTNLILEVEKSRNSPYISQ